ncbi:MAG: hypothetical protein IKY07_03920, partial [Clostridia bacterium]|nr:hypothetical protein [Clostridia bacterium]
MKKIYRSVLAAALVTGMVLPMAACSKNNKNGSTSYLYFVGVFNNDDERSTNFLNIFREVLKENDIEFDEKKLCYGD